MKRILYILTLAVAILTGCEKGGEPEVQIPLEELICGEWKLTYPDAAVYVSFSDDKTFEEYQSLNGEIYELRRGTWQLEGNVLSGKYNDEEEWAYTYQTEITDKILTLTAKEDITVKSMYTSCGIPDIVKESCTIVVKSGLF